MPTLDFKGKQFVYTHHLSVPFRTLEIDPAKSLPRDDTPSLDDNLIIHGDNLHALKALLPTYAGKVKCIYIDPPYNTGNEGWCYNDRVNSPLMREWLKKEANPVDKEDLERHDKWLSMMWPRLYLLRELLSDDGVIFVSIDDNEVTHLRMLMDEIFGPENFVAHIVVQLNPRGRTLDKHLAKTHEYVLCYLKDYTSDGISKIAKGEDGISEYKHQDEKGDYRLLELRNRNPVFNRKNRPNLYYPFWVSADGTSISLEETAVNNIAVYPLNSKGEEGCWTWGTNKASANIDKLVPKLVNTGAWRIYRKDYIPKDGADTKAKAIWLESDINNENGKEALRNIFHRDAPFDFPKSPEFIKRCINLATSSDGEHIVLDSFAGSGTTAHAVLELNKEDDGNRRFILIEMEDYANSITAERVRRIINGYEFQGIQRDVLFEQKLTYNRLKNADELLKEIEEIETAVASRFDTIRKEVKDGVLIVTGEKQVTERADGLGGSFTFCTLGEEINVTSLLKGTDLPSYDSLARYVFFTATGKTLGDLPKRRSDWFIGETDLYRVHLIYQPDREFLRGPEAALNSEMVDIITGGKGVKAPKKALVFASVKFMGQRELTERNIEFCQIPYAIHRILGD